MSYEYGFEIESILKQFFALIDKSVVVRYEKVENERRLSQTIRPFYKFSTKNRALLLSLNGAKNFTLPCVVVEVDGIKADEKRLMSKNAIISRYNNQLLEGYKMPTPIQINVTLNIITKYKTDLYQIYGNLASQFQPECFISWVVPTNIGINGIEELRNKVQWDFNLNIESKETLKEDEEDRFIGKMSFNIEGWIFHNHKSCLGNTILDIGTTELVTNELENRINDSAPLVSMYGKTYENPREYATSHIRILKAFATASINNKDFYFLISKGKYDDFKLDKDYVITLDGYNLQNAEALFVPKGKHKLKTIKFTFDSFSKIIPYKNTNKPKPDEIEGVELEILEKSQNTLKIKLPKNNYKGDFDIIVYDRIDYDTFYNAEGFYLNATK